MPNWVFNTLTIEGEKEMLNKLVAQMQSKDNVYIQTREYDVEFSFHNIISPPADKVEEYFTTAGFANGERLGNTEFNWYNWNLTNWNTKWDAIDSYIEDCTDNQILWRFDTAWSPVPNLMLRLAEQYPTLSFVYEYEEEQGWGGEVVYKNGSVYHESSYDIPSSHKDYDDLGRECSACCAGEPFDDCPKEEENGNA